MHITRTALDFCSLWKRCRTVPKLYRKI